MLPSEIEPFAQAHIQELEKWQAPLAKFLSSNGETITFTREEIVELEKQLYETRRALYRFQVCMIDEHKQKERLYQAALNCRLNHK